MVVTEAIKIKQVTAPLWQTGIGVANGTFGELLQGALRNDDDHFLVTLPIQKFSTARFTPDASTLRLTVTPTHKTKSLKLLQKLLQHYDCALGGQLMIESELPEGKGLASSSADLVATVRALEATLGHAIPTDLVLATLRTIEPTDGVMYHEFVTFFHRKVELGRRLGFPSRLKVVALDAGGQVDTIEYNQHHSRFTDEECKEYAALLANLESAIRANDLSRLGRITTRSAILNQKRNPNRYLERALTIRQQTQALGVVVAHSGPCLGLLFPHEPAWERQIARAKTLLAELTDQVFIVESLVPTR
ncbi:MAG: kinase [Blastocatellia bacterium]